MDCYGKTNQGMIRNNNEDYFFFSDSPVGKIPNLFVVADGMGGHNAGEVASYTAVTEFVEFLEKDGRGGIEIDILDVLTDGVSYANKRTYALSKERSEYNDMGTTMVACVLRKGRIYIINIGDSRIYRYRNGVLSQLTNDHTYVAMLVKNGEITEEEAMVHPRKNVITRAIGTDSNVLCDSSFFDIEENDLYLLCSDGLTGMVSKADISGIMSENISVEEKVNKLIDTANARGGKDNITVVITDAKGEA